jgi:hypothetical protein
MPVIAPLKTAKECFDTLSNLYEKKAPSQKRVLKNKLRTLKMEKDDSVASFTKISQLRDQLLVIGITVDDVDLVQTVVDGLPSSWETFLARRNAHENQLDFERLRHDCLQEEGRIKSRNGTSKEENLALATRTRRGRRFTPQKKFPQKEKSKGSFKWKEFDMTRVKCFNC